MRRFYPVILSALVLAAFLPAQEWVPLKPGARPGTPPTVEVLAGNHLGTTLDVTIPGYWVTQGPQGALLRLPGGAISTEEGRPELPFLTCTLALPTADRPLLTVRKADTTAPVGLQVRIAPKAELEGQTNVSPAPALPTVGFPTEPLQIAHSGYWREVPQLSLQIHPFKAHGDGRVTAVASHMVVDVVHTDPPPCWPDMVVPESFRSSLKAVCRNWRSVSIGVNPVEAPATEYLVLGPASLKSGVDPLLEWRRAQGYVVEWVPLTTSDPATIKGEIMTRYSAGKLLHVVLVGDYNEIPHYVWSTTNSDIWYVCLTGGSSPDLYPDAGLGRLTGSSAAQILHQANKIVRYETNPPGGSWLTNTVLAAHKEEAPGKYVGCCEEIAAGPLGASGWNVIKQYGHIPGVTNITVSNLINYGAGLVNYRGHGSTSGWSSSWNTAGGPYTISTVNALNNDNMTPVVFNIACLCGNFQSLCLQEAWLQAKHGAVASLAATMASYTSANHVFDKELYAAIFGNDLTSIYGFYNQGVARIIAFGSSGQTNARMYWWGGDSATHIWRVSPGALSVSHLTTITTATPSISVQVRTSSSPLKDARVCLWKGAELHALATTDPAGLAVFNLAGLTPGQMRVTVTARDWRPYMGAVTVGPSLTGQVIPKGFSTTEGNSRSHVPAHYAPSRSQTIYQADLLANLGSGMIGSLTLRRDGTEKVNYVDHTVTIDLSLATAGVPGASSWSTTSYSANRGSNFTRVVRGLAVNFPALAPPALPPAPFSVSIPFQQPMPYTAGSNLLVQFDVLDSPGGIGSYQWNLDAQFYNSVNLARVYGTGCPPGMPIKGNVVCPGSPDPLYFYWLSGGGYSQPALAILGLSDTNWGAIRLPLDLGPAVGAPNCWLNTGCAMHIPTVTAPGGNQGFVRVDMMVPNRPELVGRSLFTQMIVLDQAYNQAGFRASEGLELTFPAMPPAIHLYSYSSTPPFSDRPDFVTPAAMIVEVGM